MARVALQFLFKITIPFPANPTLPGDSGFHVQGPAAMAGPTGPLLHNHSITRLGLGGDKGPMIFV